MASYPVVRHAAVDDTMWLAVEICERIASVLFMIVVAPVMIVSAAAIWILSRQSPLIVHRRVGWRGETLWMLKLRTMWTRGSRDPQRRGGWLEHVEDEAGPEHKQVSDPRVAHWFAQFCRRHSIDEMPQLWHVIRGEMSLIGPRPITAVELQQYYGADAEEVLRVKPGIAGLWQTSGRNRLTYAERRMLDLRFVRNRSLGMYFRILLRTLPEVWRGNSW